MKASNDSSGYNRTQTDRVKTIHYAQDQDTTIDMRCFLDNKLMSDTCNYCGPKKTEEIKELLTPGWKRHLPNYDKHVSMNKTVCDRTSGRWVTAPWTRKADPPEPHCVEKCEQKPCIICARAPCTGLRPLMPVEERRYPYRYCSAGPTRCNGTHKEKEIENALYIVTDKDKKIKELSRQPPAALLRKVELHPSYVTTSLHDSLRPFRYLNHYDQFLNKPLPPLPPGRGEPLSLNRRADTQFGQYITDNLHPQFAWKKYPCLFRKYKFPMRRMDDTEFAPEWVNKF